VNKEASDKMGELEMLNKILKEELQKKERDIKETTNESLSISN